MVFDNWQRCITKLWQTDGKSSIMHKGTAYLIKRDKCFVVPIDTMMESPSGIRFKVIKVNEQDAYTTRIFGEVLPGHGTLNPEESNFNKKTAEIKAITEVGFLWPVAGWNVVSVPGFDSSTEQATYIDQKIPSPYRARLRPGTTSNDLLFKERDLLTPDVVDSVHLSTDLYHSTLIQSRFFIDLNSFSNCLERELEWQNELVLQHEEELEDSSGSVENEYESKTK